MIDGMANSEAPSGNRRGHVVWYDAKSECGFIKPVDGGHDLFVRPAKAGTQFGSGQLVSYTFSASGDPEKREVFIYKID
jgi:cold shock CspA family protein